MFCKTKTKIVVNSNLDREDIWGKIMDNYFDELNKEDLKKDQEISSQLDQICSLKAIKEAQEKLIESQDNVIKRQQELISILMKKK